MRQITIGLNGMIAPASAGGQSVFSRVWIGDVRARMAERLPHLFCSRR